MAAHNTASKPHVVLVALPFQGHITPAINLALKLASKGFVVTFVNAEPKRQSISKLTNSSSDIFAEARCVDLDIHYEIITEGVPELLDFSLYVKEIEDLMKVVIPAHVEKLLQKLVSETRYISCLMTDTFYCWPATMAKKFGIRFVSFWTEPAAALSQYYHADLLIKNGHFDTQVNERATTTYIPGIPSIEPADLVNFLQTPTVNTPNHDWFFKVFEQAKQADFMLLNTVQELELQCFEALELEQQQTFFAIGPIARDEALTNIRINTSLWSESDCSEWLDMQPHASVLYISFGSLFQPNKKDFEEIFYGILGSKAKFLWVCPTKSENSGELDQLLKENEDGGMAVSWCDQKEVLKHPAIGGFFTHCGWNSILESMWCEVPMLCFPLASEQFTNRKLVVKDWKIGLDIGAINEVSRDEVSKMIDSLICGSEVGITMRKKIKQVKQVMENALSPSGSSHKNFDMLVERLQKSKVERS